MSEGVAFFKAGGTMSPDAPSYIERQADADLLRALLAREYVFLLDSRQKGKSSMVARTIVRLHEQGVETVKLDLQRIGANVTPEQWYGGLLAAIGQELQLSDRLFEYWGSRLPVGPLARWVGAVEEVVLPTREKPLVVFVDEVDFVRALPFATDEFFAAIRDCYNRRSEAKGFERLTFCLVGVATPGQLIRNPEVTPFNIGTRIDISDFTEQETSGFAAVLNADGRDGAKLMQRVHYWLNGHPYLTQLLCSNIAKDRGVRSGQEVDSLVRRLFLTPEARQREPNFSDVERRLLDPDLPGLTEDEQRIQVLELYGRVLKGRRVTAAEENPVVATLRLSGVGLEDHNALRLRNRLYGVVFGESWRRQSLPDAELRRQRGAARIALLRTAAVAGVFVLGVTTIALNTSRLATERSKALTELGIKSKDLSAIAEERKTALDKLERKTVELEKLSSAQQKSLSTISDLNKDLAEESSRRLRTIGVLNATTNELERMSYDTTFYLMQDAIAKEQSDRAGTLTDSIKDSPYRGWEWAYTMSTIGLPPVVATLGIRTYLEQDETGTIQLASPTDLYDVRGHEVRHVRRFDRTLAEETRKNNQPFVSGTWAIPSGRQGKYRWWSPSYRDVFVVEDADTDKILLNRTTDRRLHDVDQYRHRYLTQPDSKETTATIEIRSFKDDEIVKVVTFDPPIRDISVLTAEVYMTRRTDESGKTIITLLDKDFKPVRKPLVLGYTNTAASLSLDHSLIVFYDDKHAEIRRLTDLSLVCQRDDRDTIMDLRFSNDLSKFVYAVGNGTIRLCETATGKTIRTLLGSDQRVMYVAFTNNDTEILSVDAGGNVRFWPVTRNANPLVVAKSGLSNVTLHYKQPERLVWTDLKSIFSYDPASRLTLERKMEKLAMVAGTAGVIYLATDNPRYVVAGFQDGTVQVLDPSSLETIRSIKVFDKGYVFVGHLGHGSLAIASNASSPIGKNDLTPNAILDLEKGIVKSRFAMKASTKPVVADGLLNSYVAMAPFNSKELSVVDPETGKVVDYLKTSEIIFDMTCSHNGKLLATRQGGHGTESPALVRIYAAKGLRLIKEIVARDTPTGLVFSPDDTLLASGGNGGGGQVWDIANGYRNYRLDGVDVRSLAFSPDSQRLITMGLVKDTLTLWDARNGAELMRLPFESDYDASKKNYRVWPPKFIQNGQGIALDGGDGSLRVWQLNATSQSKAARKNGS